MLSGIKRIFSRAKKGGGSGRDVILTGLPRTGTTLACKLLSEVNEVVGLNEPMAPEYFPNREAAVDAVAQCFEDFRTSLWEKGEAPARTASGKVTDNAYSKQVDGSRARKVERTVVQFDQPQNKNFTLVMKHCAEFSLILPELTERFACYAMVRNPIAVLGSWHSVNVPVSRGRVAKSARLLPHFYEALEAVEGLQEKQLFIMDWYFNQFKGLPETHIIRYEHLVRNAAEALSVIDTRMHGLEQSLDSQNTSSIYDSSYLAEIGAKLLDSDNACWNFYSKEEVAALLKNYID